MLVRIQTTLYICYFPVFKWSKRLFPGHPLLDTQTINVAFFADLEGHATTVGLVVVTTLSEAPSSLEEPLTLPYLITDFYRKQSRRYHTVPYEQ